MRATLVIFSGLPGTGKSVLAEGLARELSWPLLRIDDVAACIPAPQGRASHHFWDLAISGLLLLTEAQVKLGVSVIADSIFINRDRFHARDIARQAGACFLPVHTFVSDEGLWQERIERRLAAAAPADQVASWEQVQSQRKAFLPWEPGTALFLDAVRPIKENFSVLLDFIRSSGPRLEPLPEQAFTPGKYHL